MTKTMLNPILIVISIILIVFGAVWLRRVRAAAAEGAAGDCVPEPAMTTTSAADDEASKKPRRSTLLRLEKIFSIASVSIGGFLLVSRLIDMIFGPSHSDLGHISIWPERVDIFGYSVGITIVYSWFVIAVLVILALIIRFTVFRNPSDIPRGAQNVIEIIVDTVGKYTGAQVHGSGELLCSYILSVGFFLVGCAVLELFRLRAPTSDIMVTASLAILSFFLINAYGFKRKGVLGRVKSLASPTPIVFPFRLLSELAIPLSLACRLFGNMLGGFIVLDLLYGALGNWGAGIPGVLGLFFNAFHPLLQTYIFVTLTLTFTNEAIE